MSTLKSGILGTLDITVSFKICSGVGNVSAIYFKFALTTIVVLI